MSREGKIRMAEAGVAFADRYVCPYCGKQLPVDLDDKKGPEESLACLLGPFQFPAGHAHSGM